ncbi:MAG TPA: DUF1611 domain-containing protein, partial [Patescibacteria group bacterium]|nr:DUF1611 domain-containing protein [Patescibacteria group bacterium]
MDGDALILCEGHYGGTDGKTAHGLVRFTRRYRVRGVIDSTLAGRDAGVALDGLHRGIPIVASLDDGLKLPGSKVTHLVVGVATVGGRLPGPLREIIAEALGRGLNVDSGLHEFVGDDPHLAAIAKRTGARIRDVRSPAPRSELHFYTGGIAEVGCPKIALLGTDCAVGKRTTAWLLVQALERAGARAEMIATGQTGWMQGARFGILLDSIVNDFVTGEIEHAVMSAWREARPDLIVIEGQGTLIHPAYPGGFEILGAARPEAVVLQHAPGRGDLEGFPGHPVAHPSRHIEVIRLISGTPVIAITLSREGFVADEPGADGLGA